MKKAIKTLALAGLVALTTVSTGFAQSYPEKPITMIVPTPAGTIVDLIARVIGENLTKAWGEQVIVDNVGGAGGSIGVAKLAGTDADGYTLGFVPANLTVHPSLFDIKYDVEEDFIPISQVAGISLVLYVSNELDVNSVEELIALAKANPGKLSYAAAGPGSITDLSSALFTQMAELDLKRVPYTKLNLGVVDVVEGRVSMVFTSAAQGMHFVKDGSLKALGVTGSKPISSAPDLRPIAELGVPGYEIGSWFGLIAPAGVPDEIIDMLSAEVQKIGAQPEFTEWLVKAGAEPILSTPAEFKAAIKSEIPRWAALIESAK